MDDQGGEGVRFGDRAVSYSSRFASLKTRKAGFDFRFNSRSVKHGMIAKAL